jgi:hypothetical protein
MQGLAWVLPALNRSDDQGAVEALGIDSAIRKPALTTPLPAGSQAMPQRQPGFPVVGIDGLTQQQARDHPAHHAQVEALVAGRAVLTEKGDQLSMEPGTGCHWVLDWSDSPALSWLPAHPMS